jgi:hypothetical protein
MEKSVKTDQDLCWNFLRLACFPCCAVLLGPNLQELEIPAQGDVSLSFYIALGWWSPHCKEQKRFSFSVFCYGIGERGQPL